MLSAAQTARATTWPGVWQGADPSGAPIDSNGNLTTKVEGSDTWGYEWNAENQLTRVTKNAVEQARFAYDPRGRRVEKIAGGVTAMYTYDGADILRELRGASTFKYVHGPGTDEPLAREDGSGTLNYYHSDGLGSVVKRTSQAGAVTQEYRYDAWGNIEVGASEPGLSFTSREWDPEVGLAYYRARYYDPRAGRFISEDPIGLDGGLNLFEYVNGNPVNLRDPSGLRATFNCYRCRGTGGPYFCFLTQDNVTYRPFRTNMALTIRQQHQVTRLGRTVLCPRVPSVSLMLTRTSSSVACRAPRIQARQATSSRRKGHRGVACACMRATIPKGASRSGPTALASTEEAMRRGVVSKPSSIR